MKFYKCPVCGNVIYVLNGNIENIKCCNEEMTMLIPNTEDASMEKHVPFCEVINNKVIVRVGENEHPMEKEHYIMWVALVKDNNVSFVKFNYSDEAKCEFEYVKGAIVYSYCNKHGLWKKEL